MCDATHATNDAIKLDPTILCSPIASSLHYTLTAFLPPIMSHVCHMVHSTSPSCPMYAIWYIQPRHHAPCMPYGTFNLAIMPHVCHMVHSTSPSCPMYAIWYIQPRHHAPCMPYGTFNLTIMPHVCHMVHSTLPMSRLAMYPVPLAPTCAVSVQYTRRPL